MIEVRRIEIEERIEDWDYAFEDSENWNGLRLI